MSFPKTKLNGRTSAPPTVALPVRNLSTTRSILTRIRLGLWAVCISTRSSPQYRDPRAPSSCTGLLSSSESESAGDPGQGRGQPGGLHSPGRRPRGPTRPFTTRPGSVTGRVPAPAGQSLLCCQWDSLSTLPVGPGPDVPCRPRAAPAPIPCPVPCRARRAVPWGFKLS